MAIIKGADDEDCVKKSTVGTPYHSENQMEMRWGEMEKESEREGAGEKDERVPIRGLF